MLLQVAAGWYLLSDPSIHPEHPRLPGGCEVVVRVFKVVANVLIGGCLVGIVLRIAWVLVGDCAASSY